METFKKGDKVGKYIVNTFIKKGAIAESYTAFGSDDMMYFLKIYDLSMIPRTHLLQGTEVFEIALCQELDNDNVIRFVDKGEVRKDGKTFRFLVTQFYRGDLLFDCVRRDGVFDAEDAVQITMCVLNGLAYLHANALVHNDLRPSNVMLQETEEGMLMPTIIDLGHVSYMVMGRPTFSDNDLMPFFRAPETFKGVYTPKSDLFSVGALLYFMLFGKAPWEFDLEACQGDKVLVKEATKQARKEDLVLETEMVKIPDYLKIVLKKALAKKPDDRFNSAVEFLLVLQNQVLNEMAENEDLTQVDEPVELDLPQMEMVPQSDFVFKKGSGNGFDNVTGRNELKEQIRKEVLFVLQDVKKAEKYQLPSVNGVLLFGPPGCGKSLLLKNMAEELGFNYTVIEAAKFGNIYQPGVLDNLQRLFDAAELKAPFAICIDEIEFLIPSRGEAGITQQASEVFGMMNLCSERQILLIATSNQPNMVDGTIMRMGCIDKVYFVPLPDFEARKDIFKSHLHKRPCEELDYDVLAKMSQDFVVGDIAETVNEAAVTAAYMDVPISQKILTDVLRFKNPTYSPTKRIGFNK